MPKQIVVWSPQPGPQHAFVTCPAFDVMGGGSRGGGKTDGALGDWGIHSGKYGKHCSGLFVRKTLTQLDDAIKRSHEIYPKLGARWKEQAKTWVMPNGATLRFRPCESIRDAEKYMGHNYTRVYAEELTNWPSPDVTDRLKATLRNAHGIPVGFRATCNPGGPGHNWVKSRYVDPAPRGRKVLKDEHGNTRVFIPSTLDDNVILMESNPGYEAILRLAGNEKLFQAWRYGNWDIVDGAFFDCWSYDSHVIPWFRLPSHWHIFRSFDWGGAKPFSVGWWTVADGDYENVPRGALIRIAEWYGCEPDQQGNGQNVGLRLTAEQVSAGIVQREEDLCDAHGVDQVIPGPADPSIFAENGGPSIAERMWPVFWDAADNSRVGRHGHVGGWDQMRGRMKGELDADGNPIGVPMVYCFDNCTDTIRTLPTLQSDPLHPDDVDTTAEDHIADEFRYACMSRPWEPTKLTVVVQKRRDYGMHDTSTSWRV